MDDPRVANLVVQFLRERYFDCELDAWRAARRLVLEIDLMAAEADDPHRSPPAGHGSRLVNQIVGRALLTKSCATDTHPVGIPAPTARPIWRMLSADPSRLSIVATPERQGFLIRRMSSSRRISSPPRHATAMRW